MGVSWAAWALTLVVVVGLLSFDYIFQVREAHVPTLREAVVWSTIYIGTAIVFGIAVLVFGGTTMGVQYFACYLSNEALSIDNLFVFLVMISSFAVPRTAQQKVLLFGIVFALVARTGAIFVGAALVTAYRWMFYLFGVIVLITAVNMVKPLKPDDRAPDNMVIRVAKRYLRTSERYDGHRLLTVENGKRVMTPMLLVMIALGGTDLLFAFDSIPALFGLSQNVYLVFTATVFSVLGLRQLYFLIDGLLDRLVHLSYGLAVILGFIGAKLMLQAVHDNNVPFINRGKPVPVAEVGNDVSLTVIALVVIVTALTSLLSRRAQAQNTAARARRHAIEYLDPRYETNPAEREKIFRRLLHEERQIDLFPTKLQTEIRQESGLMDLLRQAHRAHDSTELA